ncbi:hypothetical protein SH580_13865 [Coraliomargarita algicola]|uniref:Type 4 fimbrial biogenesis protein PilX N-terminal domain-containing protein n=1 Tax=Coraliomargarita algicola TaxID=3092156 RepID=A0ABZ0RG72_9BACT|nr:hypothetical protein [Coraliomargarita sp. J2-16]WPJ94518.1 hypothetical protein SH580_13865 [Coraliomargarita sp. J2-16]
MHTFRINRPRPLRQQGSALLLAMIFSSILAVVAIPTYLKLSQNTVALAYRAHYNVAAVNLAESGIEYAVHTISEVVAGRSDWDDWTVVGNDASIALDSYTYVGDITGTLSIYIIGYQSEAPEVLSKATIEFPNQADIEKYMYAQISSSSSRGLFAYGMLTKNSINAGGGVVFDSWISGADQDSSAAFQFYDASLSRDSASIATASTAAGAIDLGSSDVYGTAAVGSSENSGLTMGWGGHVGPRDASLWHPSDSEHLELKDPKGWKVSLETGALKTGFSASFEDITAPDLELTDLRYTYQLPYTDRQKKSNASSTWYENVYVNQETIGSPGRARCLSLIHLSSNRMQFCESKAT